MIVRAIACLLLGSMLGLAYACETKREVFIENAETKVWRTTICPNQVLPFHTHQFARVLIPEETGALKVIYQSGKNDIILLKKRTPILLDKAQGSSPHQDVNMGQYPIHVTVVELKR